MSHHHDGLSQSLPEGSIAATAPLPPTQGLQQLSFSQAAETPSTETPSTDDSLPVHDFLARLRKADPSARRRFLYALAPELTTSECNELCNYRKTDIIGRLPLDLALQVFSHLDVAASFRLQAISKPWRDKLQSFEFFNQQRRQWYGCDYLGRRAVPSLDDSRQRREAKRIHRMSTGRPTEHLLLPELIHTTLEWSLKFCNDTLYWVPTPPGPGRPAEGRCVLSYNLYTGLLREFFLPTRERIHFVAISEELLLMSTKKGSYWVTDLSSGRMKQFRLDHCVLMYENIQCHRRQVMVSRTIERQSVLWVYTWNFDTGRGEDWNIKVADGFANTPQIGLPPLPIFIYKDEPALPPAVHPFDDLEMIALYPVEPGTQNIAPGNPSTTVVAYTLERDTAEFYSSVRCSYEQPVCFQCFGSYCRSPPPKTSSMPILRMPSKTAIPESSQACGNLRNVMYKPSFRLRRGAEHKGPCHFTCCLGTPTSPIQKEFPCISCSLLEVSHGLVRNRPLDAKWIRMCGDDNTIIMMWPSPVNDLWTLEVFCFDKEKRLHRENLQAAMDSTMKRVREYDVN